MPYSNVNRSAPGAGSIRQKIVERNGRTYIYWEARYSAGTDPKTGKQSQRSITGKSKKEVSQRLREVTSEIDRGVYCAPCKMTVGEWLDIWSKEYLFGVKASMGYKIIFVIVVVIGATLKLSIVWDIADTLNGLMAIPNLIALLGLSGVVIKVTKDHFSDKSNLQ